MSEALLFPHLQPGKAVREGSDLSMVSQPERGSALSEVPLVPSPSSPPSGFGRLLGLRKVEALILEIQTGRWGRAEARGGPEEVQVLASASRASCP